MCQGTGTGVTQTGIPSPLHMGVDGSLSLFKAVSSGAWKPRSGASRQSPPGRSPPGRSPPGRGPRVDPALLTTFIFSKITASGINLMLKRTQAAYFTLTILHHMLYVLLGIKCSHVVHYFRAYT